VEKNEDKLILATNPFVAGRTEMAERYMHLSNNAAQWRRISIVLLICCAACVFAVINTANKTTVVPYIVQVDQHKYRVAVEPVRPANIDQVAISTIARYIWSLKTVFTDREAQMYLINFVMRSTPAKTQAEDRYKKYLLENNPLDAAITKTSINVNINSVLRLPDRTWQAEWTEVAFQEGKKLWTKHYRGIFKTTVNRPKDMDEIFVNPLGVHITDFDFIEM
jgi:type IV secretion system protein VirB5